MKAKIHPQQQGMALVIGLIIMLVMTLISVTAMRSTIMQERMAGAFQGRQLALQSSEAALRHARQHLEQPVLPSFTDGSDGFFHFNDPSRSAPAWEDPAADLNRAGVLAHDRDFEAVAEQPLYFIERVRMGCRSPDLEAGTPDNSQSFRIMALGFGKNENAQVVLESFYCR